MKLTATMMLSVDGVHEAREAPGEPAQFERWGWVAASNDEETWRFLISMFERAGALLLGRPDLGDLRRVLGRTTTRAIRSPTALTSCPSTFPRPRSRNRAGTPRSSRATSRRRSELKASPDDSPRSTAAASCSDDYSSATSSTSSISGSVRSRWARGLRLFLERGMPDADRVTLDAVRRDAPDASTGPPRDLRNRRLRAHRGPCVAISDETGANAEPSRSSWWWSCRPRSDRAARAQLHRDRR